MLDYLKTVESLRVIRDELRSRLDDESRDRQSIAEFAEASLTKILGELVTPDPMCFICESAGANTPGTAGQVIETGQGVCPTHLFGALMMGYGVHVHVPIAEH